MVPIVLMTIFVPLSFADQLVEKEIDALRSLYLPTVDLKVVAQSIRVNAAGKALLAKRMTNFKVAAAGHSVVAGHGNYFNESYPAVLDELLKKGFNAVGLEAEAHNYGMGGTASLPLGWCLKAIIGHPALVSWDFGMVEGKDVRIAETFARAVWQLGSVVLFVTTDPARIHLLEDRYPTMPWAIAPPMDHLLKLPSFPPKMHRSHNVSELLKDISFSPSNEKQKSRKFRTPTGAPGRVKWHPGWRLHRLFASVLAVWLLTELKEALTKDLAAENHPLILPPSDRPQCGDPGLGCERPLRHCATTYEPKRSGDLRDLVVLPASWPNVLAQGDPSLRAERLGLGYLDRKFTFEGRQAYGPLRLRLPLSHQAEDPVSSERSLLLCQATTGWRKPADLRNLHEACDVFTIDYRGHHQIRLSLTPTRHVPNCFMARGLPRRRPPSSSEEDHLDLLLNVTADASSRVYLSHVVWF